MKRTTIIAIFALLLAAPSFAQNKKRDVAFDAYEWDFGTILAEAGTVCHTFTMQNKSKEPVTIGSAIPVVNASKPSTPLMSSCQVRRHR